jgi:hypothetical protein
MDHRSQGEKLKYHKDLLFCAAGAMAFTHKWYAGGRQNVGRRLARAEVFLLQLKKP